MQSSGVTKGGRGAVAPGPGHWGARMARKNNIFYTLFTIPRIKQNFILLLQGPIICTIIRAQIENMFKFFVKIFDIEAREHFPYVRRVLYHMSVSISKSFDQDHPVIIVCCHYMCHTCGSFAYEKKSMGYDARI